MEYPVGESTSSPFGGVRGGKDENVFDIQQGVSISLFVKTINKSKSMAEVYHFDSFGEREVKYDALWNGNIASLNWTKLEPVEPYYFFVPYNEQGSNVYKEGFIITELMTVNNSGISTDRDSLFIDFDKKSLSERISTLLNGSLEQIFIEKYRVIDSSGYSITTKIKNKIFKSDNIQNYHYRPFDFLYIYFDNEITSRPAKVVSNNLLNKENVGLIVPRQVQEDFKHVFITNKICDSNITSNARLFGAGKVFPLYLYDETEGELDFKAPHIPPKGGVPFNPPFGGKGGRPPSKSQYGYCK